MFIGIDHGTTSMRFVSSDGIRFKISRHDAAGMTQTQLLTNILQHLGVSKTQIKMIALTYSMGDGISRIMPIDSVPDRGIISRGGAGIHVGGGTKVFDTIQGSGIPAIVIPGLHRDNTPDPRFNVFSHGTSPEKIGIAYLAHRQGHEDLIVSDISSNTVTLAVVQGRLRGAIDACIFAPGIHHGPLDLEAIRNVDAGLYTANEAFTRAGVIKLTGQQNLKELVNAYQSDDSQAELALDTLALFASMEIVSMGLVLRETGINEPAVFISGSLSELFSIKQKIEIHTGFAVTSMGEWSAAQGLACIAKDVHEGAKDILGIFVEY